MAKQAEAERDARAKVIQAEGEFQAAEKLHPQRKSCRGLRNDAVAVSGNT